MAKSLENTTVEETLGQYQGSLTEHSNRSILQLKCSPREGSITFTEDKLDAPVSITVANENPDATCHKPNPSQAVCQLRALLHQQPTKENEVSTSRQKIPSLENLKFTYKEKKEALEPQLKFLRGNLAEYQEDCEEHIQQLKHKDSILVDKVSRHIGGLCLKCAQHEAVLSQTHNNVHLLTIQRLNKERDDLISALISVRSSLTEVQRREASTYEQVKQAVQMTEEANFEKTKTLIQCEQLKDELEKQTERLEKELVSQQEKWTFEKMTIKKEITKERDEMRLKMLALSQNIAQLEADIEKVTREKTAATNQLERIQKKLVSQEEETTKALGEMQYQLNKIKMEKDEAEKEHKEHRTKFKRDLDIKSQEIEKLKSELSESQQLLEKEQQKAVLAQEECLKLTDLLSKSEHQLHHTRLEKITFSKAFSMKQRIKPFRPSKREQELIKKIQQMEEQHDKTENEQFSLMSSQNTFLKKLKEEYHILAKKLEQIYQNSNLKISELNQEKLYLNNKLDKLQKRNNELEKQCVQHGRVHEIMKQRLMQLEKYSQVTAQQLLQLLKKQNQFLLEQNVTEDVELLEAEEIYQMMENDCLSDQLQLSSAENRLPTLWKEAVAQFQEVKECQTK